MFFRKVKELQGLLEARTKALKNAEEQIAQRDKLLGYQHDKNLKQKEKIKDLENNIEFLVNNLSKQKRELVRPSNQN